MGSNQMIVPETDFLAASGRRHESTQTQSQIDLPKKPGPQEENAAPQTVPRLSRPHIELNAPQLVVEGGTTLIQDSNAASDAHSLTSVDAGDLFSAAYPGERRPSAAGEGVHRPSATLIELNRAEQQRLAQLHALALAPFGIGSDSGDRGSDSTGADSSSIPTRMPPINRAPRRSPSRSETTTSNSVVAVSNPNAVLPPIGHRLTQVGIVGSKNSTNRSNEQQPPSVFLTSLVRDALKTFENSAPERVMRLPTKQPTKMKPKTSRANPIAKFLPKFYRGEAANVSFQLLVIKLILLCWLYNRIYEYMTHQTSSLQNYRCFGTPLVTNAFIYGVFSKFIFVIFNEN